MTDPVAIVGGGFSGAMLAARLAEAGVASRLIERSGRFGTGVAYSTPCDAHLLNVRAGRMSAVEGSPDDFVDWLKAHHPEQADPEGFVPRRLYGLYVQDRLTAVEAAHPGRIARITGDVVAVGDNSVSLADGRALPASAVVLCTGNPAPATTRAISPRILSDPWSPGALDRIGEDDDILILGTGLTMVDVLLALAEKGWRGRATALSRRGLPPRAHLDRPERPAALTDEALTGPVSRRLGAARRLAAREGWRPVMEGYRPITADLWSQADIASRGRFLRHLRPWWDVHRHRIAPQIGRAMDALVAGGRLTLASGRIRAITPENDGARLDWTRRGATQAPLAGRWLIDCTGPGHDATTDPLTGPLIAQGRAQLDPLGLGLDLDDAGRVIDVDGRSEARLFVLGPPARAAFWETIAVPDVRKRIEALTHALLERKT